MTFRFSEMLVTVMQTSYQKIDHKIKHYCNYKDICNDIINESLHQLFQQNWNNNCDKDVDKFFLSYSKVLDKYAPWRKKYMLSLIISRLWIKFCLKLLCDEKNFPRVFLKIGLLFHFAVYYFTINGVGYRQDLSSACKSDRADFTDWLSFISFNLMQELNPNPETNA